MAKIFSKNLFITGKPGCGKTTLIRESCLAHRDEVGGFVTEEIKENNARLGFSIKTFNGQSAVFAKKGMKSACKLNKYGIDLHVLDTIAVESIRNAMHEKKIIVIDEIGAMEVLSATFRSVITECLNSSQKILATIRYKSQPFTNEIKKMADTSLLYLSRENFWEVKKQVKEWLGPGVK